MIRRPPRSTQSSRRQRQMCIRDSVDGGVHIGGSGLDARQSVGRGHAEVVVSVHLDVEPALFLEERDDVEGCLLYTSDAADDLLCVALGGRRIIKKKKK